MNNRMEQDHRGIKQRSYPMRSFGSFDAAARFCSAHDERRDHLRVRTHMNETVTLAHQRWLFQDRWGEVCAVMQAAKQRASVTSRRRAWAITCLYSES